MKKLLGILVLGLLWCNINFIFNKANANHSHDPDYNPVEACMDRVLQDPREKNVALAARVCKNANEFTVGCMERVLRSPDQNNTALAARVCSAER